MRFVLDASVTLPWCFEDQAGRYSDAVLDSLSSNQAIVPRIWTLEIANGLLVAERKKILKAGDTATFIEKLNALPIHLNDSLFGFEEILEWARKAHISSYDASYVELAVSKSCPLATLDAGMKKACKRVGVEIWSG